MRYARPPSRVYHQCFEDTFLIKHFITFFHPPHF